MRFEIDVQQPHEVFDIFDGQLGIPAIVDVHGERTEPPLLGRVECIGAVDAAAEANEAVIRTIAAGDLNPFNELLEISIATGRSVSLLSDERIVRGAIRTKTLSVERNAWDLVVEDAARADSRAHIYFLPERSELSEMKSNLIAPFQACQGSNARAINWRPFAE
jgi:hypothetical protein